MMAAEHWCFSSCEADSTVSLPSYSGEAVHWRQRCKVLGRGPITRRNAYSGANHSPNSVSDSR